MDWIIAILVGALIGWLASLVMRTDAQQGAIANILIGIVGSALGNWVFGSLLNLGVNNAGALSLSGILWGVIGAVILIAILKAVRVLR